MPNDTESNLDQLIVANEKMRAIELIRMKSGCSIPEALDILARRYRELRVAAPQLFKRTDEEFWAGFYS
ncbi:MAG: hypothetical protein V4773_29865 [Verrucomicrobiota bacterium]